MRRRYDLYRRIWHERAPVRRGKLRTGALWGRAGTVGLSSGSGWSGDFRPIARTLGFRPIAGGLLPIARAVSGFISCWLAT